MAERSAKMCLVVIYNHNYERNIPAIERIYAGRFSRIYHLMPFYRGRKENVVCVYDSSFQFSGYVAQAYRQISDDAFSHYVFVSDDLLIFPDITEGNICDKLCIDARTGFTPVVKLVDSNELLRWPYGISTFLNLNSTGNACEFFRFLPSKDEARRLFCRHGLNVDRVVKAGQFNVLKRMVQPYWHNPYVMHYACGLSWLARLTKFFSFGEDLYPVAHGFSDMFVVPASCMDTFAHYCGVFSAARVFVEAAIPMSLMFSCEKVKTLKDVGMNGFDGNSGASSRERLISSFDYDYARIVAEFPSNYLYVHPVKLSKWKNLP